MTRTDGAEGTAPKRRNFHGRRQGRKLRAGRAALIETLLPQLTVALPAEGGALDPLTLFPRPAREVWVEIGFGAGEHLAWQAGHHPDVGIIGCEPYINGMSTLLAAVAGEKLDMVRLWADDARPLLDRQPDGSVSRIFLLFADPWPKLRHHGRRFVQDDTVADLARLLRDDGELRIATDDAPLLDWSLDHVRRNPAFAWTARGPADWRERPADWPPTRYEQKALHGRPYYLRFHRLPRAAAAP